MALFTGHTITPDSALGGTQIQRSLRFAGAAFNSISRTPSSTGNQKVWTWSCWFKRTKLGNGSYNYLVSSYGNNDGIAAIYFDSSDRINTYFDTSGSNPYGSVNERRYRDIFAWMHIVWQVDAINGTQKIWINGVEESLSSSLNPPNFSYTMNQSGQLQTIGGAAWYPDGTGNNNYLTEIHFSDGNKYTPSDFAYTDAQTGQWRPKNGNVIKSNITYGTNGYWLDFRDNTSTTTLGYDYSGNGNHWTLNNMSVAAGSDNDSVTDTPTNNFPTLSSVDMSGNAPSDGNLRGGTAGTSGWRHTRSTVLLTSGKWYWEVKLVDGTPDGSNGYMTGIAYPSLGLTQDVNSDSRGMYGRQNQEKYLNDNSNPVDSDFTTTADGDVLQYAWDVDNGKLYHGKNNSWEESADPSAGTNANWTGVASGASPFVGSYGSSIYTIINFGQQEFSYTPPTGYASLSGHNRATPVAAGVVNPQRHFDTLLWTGANTVNSRNITGLDFKPDWVWIKARNRSSYGGGLNYHHMVWDSVRGVGSTSNSSGKDLATNQAIAESSSTTYSNLYGHISSFNRDGFTVQKESGEPAIYTDYGSTNYVAWCWKAGGAAVSNSDGTITSSVSANTEAGFSIVSYTGNETNNATVGHGLGKSPDMVIIKDRDSNTAGNNWYVFHSALASGHYVKLNQTSATTAVSGTSNGGIGSVTSTTFNFVQGTTGNNKNVNENGDNFIAYCWTEIPGYSKFGSYTGNGVAEGTFVHTGFRVGWLMTKRVNEARNWIIYDNKRGPFNEVDNFLEADQTSSEDSKDMLDFTANGFKLRDSDSDVNEGNSTYIYMAFAERPSGTMFGLDANAR